MANLKKDTPEEQCPPSLPPLRRSKRNIPEDSTSPIKKNPHATRISNSQLIQPKAITAPPPIPRLKRKHSDSEPIPLSPPSRKRKLATEVDGFTTPPTSPTKHSMCLRNSPKSSQPQTLMYITPDIFKTPRKVLLLDKRCLKGVKLEFNTPDPDNHTSLTGLFNYDGIVTMTSTPVPGSPPPIPSQYIHS